MDPNFLAQCAERAFSGCLDFAISGMTAQATTIDAVPPAPREELRRTSPESALALVPGRTEGAPLPPGMIEQPRPGTPPLTTLIQLECPILGVILI